MQYSPKLKRVMAEIRAIIEREDLAAFICLVEPGHAEYLNVIDPSFSAASLDGRGGLRLQTKGLDMTKARKRQLLLDTANMAALLSKTVFHNGIKLTHMSEVIKQETGASHGDMSHLSQSEIDN